MQDVELTWAEKLEQKGLITGKRETLLRQLSARFGTVTDASRTRVEAIDSLEELDTLLDRVLTATSLDEMKL